MRITRESCREASRKLRGRCHAHSLPSLAPTKAPTPEDIEHLVNHVVNAKKGGLLVITGAGVSTESGIPDYRSPNGSYSRGHKPMTHQEFVKSDLLRRRFWARNVIGWRRFNQAKFNRLHTKLAMLEEAGWIGGLITQNVDGLHQLAGHKDVLELHGSNRRVRCWECGWVADRIPYQARVEDTNAAWLQPYEHLIAAKKYETEADGDSSGYPHGTDFSNFQVPVCGRCGAPGSSINGAPLVSPDVVYFGGSVPKDQAARAMEMSEQCTAVLALGTTLQTYSAFRLVRASSERKRPLLIVCDGETRADQLLGIEDKEGSLHSNNRNPGMKVRASCGDVVDKIAESLL